MVVGLRHVFLVEGQVFLGKDKCFRARTSVFCSGQVFLV